MIAWHEKHQVPLGATLCEDERCRIVQGDCFERIRNGPAAEFDAILIDIDDGPEEVLNPDHLSFYSIEGLRDARRCLRPDGVFGLWTRGIFDLSMGFSCLVMTACTTRG